MNQGSKSPTVSAEIHHADCNSRNFVSLFQLYTHTHIHIYLYIHMLFSITPVTITSQVSLENSLIPFEFRCFKTAFPIRNRLIGHHGLPSRLTNQGCLDKLQIACINSPACSPEHEREAERLGLKEWMVGDIPPSSLYGQKGWGREIDF